MLIFLFLKLILAQELGRSVEYGIISNPFTSISGMGLINHFLYCIGNLKVYETFTNQTANMTTDMGGDGQVWATRTDINVPWSLSFASNSSIKKISVKHSKLGIEQSLMLLLKQDGIDVLPFWFLSPRETPDKNHSSWTIPVNVDTITGLSASGGVYGLRGGKICWIQVIKPYTLEKILDTTITAQGNRTNQTNSTNQTDSTNTQTISHNKARIQDVEGLESSYRIWLGLDSTTLYMIVRGNGTQVLKSVGLEAHNLKSEVREEIQVQEGDVIDFIVHPRTFDYYFVVGNIVKVYGNDKSLKGTIVPSFPVVTSLEIDNDGKTLYIGGKDDQPKGRLDVFDLERAELSKVSSGSKNAQLCELVMIVLYLKIMSFL